MYKYLNSKFSFLKADTCIWTNMPYGEDGGFAIGPNDENTSKIYKVSNESQCKIIPIIEAEKNALISYSVFFISLFVQILHLLSF